MKIIEKDILTVERGIIAHQVNCQGVMGAGLALKIAQKWPKTKERYLLECQAYWLKRKLLGKKVLHVVDESGPLVVAHLFGQFNYGRDRQYTDYPALYTALESLSRAQVPGEEQDIYMPYGLGAGLAGGDWAVISKAIDRILPEAIICHLPGTPYLMKEGYEND